MLKGEKALLKMQEVRFTNVPPFGEIGVKHMYQKALTLPRMRLYFPDSLPKSRTMDR